MIAILESFYMQTALRPFNEFAKQSLQTEFSILVLFSLVSLQKMAKGPGAKRYPSRGGGPGVLFQCAGNDSLLGRRPLGSRGGVLEDRYRVISTSELEATTSDHISLL